MKTNVYDDMKKLHEMVEPFRRDVAKRRMGKAGKMIFDCADTITELAKSVDFAIVAVTNLIAAHNKFAKSKNKGLEIL